jgi:signal transduction histidine kinase
VALLRQPADIAPRSPVSGIAHLDELATATSGSGLPVSVHVQGVPESLPSTVDSTAYRIVQEALTNAVRHSGAGQVDVFVGYSAQAVTIVVRDDGRGGVERAAAEPGHGLAGMRERAELLGGTLTAGSLGAGQGFEVRAMLPTASTVDASQ